jgi:hypothetical protein
MQRAAVTMPMVLHHVAHMACKCCEAAVVSPGSQLQVPLGDEGPFPHPLVMDGNTP